MSLDRIWLCRTLKRGDWIEVFAKSRRLNSNDETFSDEFIETESLGYRRFYVSVIPGGGLFIDEEYRFRSEAHARRFFQGGPLGPDEQSYRDREYFDEGAGPDGCDLGKGFDRVELYVDGELIAEHPPNRLSACVHKPK